jgi:hypothetical protein
MVAFISRWHHKKNAVITTVKLFPAGFEFKCTVSEAAILILGDSTQFRLPIIDVEHPYLPGVRLNK